jgi:hypothetical protein
MLTTETTGAPAPPRPRAAVRAPAPTPPVHPSRPLTRPRGLRSPVVRLSIAFFGAVLVITAILVLALSQVKGRSFRGFSAPGPADIGEIR